MKKVLTLLSILICILTVGCSNDSFTNVNDELSQNINDYTYWKIGDIEYSLHNDWVYRADKSSGEMKFYYLNNSSEIYLMTSSVIISEEEINDPDILNSSLDALVNGFTNDDFELKDTNTITLLDSKAFKNTYKIKSIDAEIICIFIVKGKYCYTFGVKQDNCLTEETKILFDEFVNSFSYEKEDEYKHVEDSYGFDMSRAKKVTDRNVLVACWTVAEFAVKDQLKSPSSAKFPFSAIDSDVEIYQDGNQFCVISWVQAENSFGSSIKSQFVVLIEKRNGKYYAYDCAIE